MDDDDTSMTASFARLSPGQLKAAVKDYADDVRKRAFPGPDHVYGMKKK